MSALECLFLSLSPPSFISERPPNINRYQSDVTKAGTNTMCHCNLNTFVQVDVHVGVNQPCWYNGGRGTDGSQGKALNFHVDAVALFLFLSHSSWMLIVSVPLKHSLLVFPLSSRSVSSSNWSVDTVLPPVVNWPVGTSSSLISAVSHRRSEPPD